MVALAVFAAGEWLRRPTPSGAGTVVAASVTAALLLWPWARWRTRLLALTLLALGGVAAVGQWHLVRIERTWEGPSGEREARIVRASRRLGDDLHAAFHRADRLAEGAAAFDGSSRADAFTALARTARGIGPEVGVAILEADGTPWAWAGRHRLLPVAEGDSIASRSSKYYVTLEARRHSAAGRVVIATVLIWAHPAVPDRESSVAERFLHRTDVGLQVYSPGAAPDNANVFDYTEPTTAGERLFFSVQLVPPEQGAAKELSLARARAAVSWLLAGSVLLALGCAASVLVRLIFIGVLLLAAARAPLGTSLGLDALFSPATFFVPLGRGALASAGVLALGGALLAVAGVWLWQRRPRAGAGGMPTGGTLVALALVAAVPFGVRALGRAITPPATGVSIGLWLTWQVALVLAVTAAAIIAAALLRPTGPPARWRAPAAVGLALAAAIVGLVAWQPATGWPPWFPVLWAPALALAVLPAPRWSLVAGLAVVIGSLAALVTWDAELRGRLNVAQRDVSRLGPEPDPLAVPPLERFGEAVARGPAPTSATELYALWHGSVPRREHYPAHLALWDSIGRLRANLPLDSLDVATDTLGAMATRLRPGEIRRVIPLKRVPGVVYVLVTRVADGGVLTAAIGPRSALIAPSRLGRLLDPTSRPPLRYRLALAPRTAGYAATSRPLVWRRDGWVVRGERDLVFPGGTRRVHAVVDLRGPVPVLVRGALVVLLDAAALALLWLFAELAAGARAPVPAWGRLAGSFRIRLAVTLAAFFLLPTIGFSAWGFTRLRDEARRGRDLLITQTLRDAVLAAGEASGPPNAPLGGLVPLARRVGADLAAYQGGALRAVSAPILRDLGVVSELLPPDVFQTLSRGGTLELTHDGPVPSLAERIGYRVLQPGGTGELAVLATPQAGDERSLAVTQLDLAFVLLLATLLGVAAAVTGAQRAARALSRPVSELRRSAVAIGQGRPMPAHAPDPPAEFAPVFGAFERMAADIRSTQRALEEARRRTATVLATVATAVVALDPEGRILLANPRARDLLGLPLTEGTRLLDALGPGWSALREAIPAFFASPSVDVSTAEVTDAGQRLTLQLASLGPDIPGVVLAINDVTDLSRAERVLAWGEMARQVAHEIKNPLTPIRLGMQHLRRVYRDHDRRGDFDRTLEDTAERVLQEIDRLDTIARAFSRFAAPAVEQVPLAPVDAAGVAQEVVQLYSLAEDGTRVELVAPAPVIVPLRRDELKEVLVNLLENARNAGARRIVLTIEPGCIRVQDDGRGIPPELIPRIFEPRFSTNTSGSGLGLAIVRRLVESWGGRVEVESELGRGTLVSLVLD